MPDDFAPLDSVLGKSTPPSSLLIMMLWKANMERSHSEWLPYRSSLTPEPSGVPSPADGL